MPEANIIQEGEELTKMYITGVGRCNVYQKFQSKTNILVSEVIPGTIFGELQMLVPGKADFTLVSQQHSILVSISRMEMEKILWDH